MLSCRAPGSSPTGRHGRSSCGSSPSPHRSSERERDGVDRLVGRRRRPVSGTPSTALHALDDADARRGGSAGSACARPGCIRRTRTRSPDGEPRVGRRPECGRAAAARHRCARPAAGSSRRGGALARREPRRPGLDLALRDRARARPAPARRSTASARSTSSRKRSGPGSSCSIVCRKACEEPGPVTSASTNARSSQSTWVGSSEPGQHAGPNPCMPPTSWNAVHYEAGASR